MNIIMSLLSSNGYIIVNKEIIKRLGLHEAIVLGEMCSEYTYWEKENKLQDGFFFSTRENIEENTGLSAYQQRDAFKKLVDNGIITEKLLGMPQKKWYSLDMSKLYQIFNSSIDLTPCTKETTHQEVKKLDDKASRNFMPSNQETISHDVKKLDINNNNNNNNNNNKNSNKKESEKKQELSDK